MEDLPILALRHPWLLAGLLFCSLLLSLEAGRALGRRQPTARPNDDGVGLIEGSLFALLGLLLALSFSAAANRFEMRRSLIVEEANAIGTARLRIDVLPQSYWAPMSAAFDRYVRSRDDAYRLSDDPREFREALKRSAVIQKEIWAMAAEGGRKPDAAPGANVLLMPALNAMIDITTTRAMAMRMHTPQAVFVVLWLSALAADLVAGHRMASGARSWLSILTFVTVVTCVLYLLIDLEYPRLGLVRIDSFDAVLANGEP